MLNQTKNKLYTDNHFECNLVLDLIVINTDDGFTAEVPTIKGCESWAHTEDDAIEKTLELFRFYIQVEKDFKIKIDLARKEGKRIVYKLIFDKP